ncbi:Dynein, 78 kDa intermediate chain, flagellar outer arm-like 1, partial [Homarus americanus]
GEGGTETGGLVCLYTLKNPGAPERLLHTPTALTSVHLHPTRASVLVGGLTDGSVMFLDARLSRCPRVLISTTSSGKHLLPVS